jgi:hypothetical protein
VKDARDDLLDADRTFLTETEELLGIYEAMHWLKARPPAAPLGEGIVWAREIVVSTGTVAIVATRASLGCKSFHVRFVSAPGEPFALEDQDVVDLSGLTPTLEKLIGQGPAFAPERRPRRRIRHRRNHR